MCFEASLFYFAMTGLLFLNLKFGDFASAWWLRPQASPAGDTGSIPSQGTKILPATWMGQCWRLADHRAPSSQEVTSVQVSTNHPKLQSGVSTLKDTTHSNLHVIPQVNPSSCNKLQNMLYPPSDQKTE